MTALSATVDSDLRAIEDVAAARVALRQQLGRRVIGQLEIIDQLLVALLCRGHCLFVGVPGLGKTLLISTLAEALELTFNRIQFTPDLMPSDITGTEVLEEDRATGQRHFRFLQGPVFANLLLADEINRTPPKTQAALLQAMQERKVSVGGKTHELGAPFLVFADTQNPIEQEGTYPLPEAQLDRFMLQLEVGYPSADEELQIAQLGPSSGMAPLERVLDPQRIVALQQLVDRAPVAEHVVKYAVELARATRPGVGGPTAFVDRLVAYGAGPRASQFLVLGAKARALLEGRPTATRADVAAIAPHVLRHRIVPSFAAESDGLRGGDIAARILAALPA